MSLLHLLEPEETIGNAWHRLVGGGASVPHFADAAVSLDDVVRPLRVFFHGLGGAGGVEIAGAIAEVSHHRLARRIRIGTRAERVPRARFDGERLRLPVAIDCFPDPALNERLYYWLTAWMALAADDPPRLPAGPWARDIARIDHARTTTARVLVRFPGLLELYRELSGAVLAMRPERALPAAEAHVEMLIRRAIGDPSTPPTGSDGAPPLANAPGGYRTYLPVPLWGEIECPRSLERQAPRDDEPGAGPGTAGDGKSRRGERRRSDQIRRKGFFFVHRFEKILTWTEFMNLHRDVEDDDAESARKAADDHDVLGVTRLDKRAATRLKIDLDLAPADVDAEQLSSAHSYPEWDFRRQAYLPCHVRVLEREGEPAADENPWTPGPGMQRRIRAVRRRFEALRPRREILSRQLDGHELDMDALVRAKADMNARGEASDRVYRQAREEARDLSVAVLIDVSRSTEGFVDNRAVIDIEKEALIALVEGLESCGDEAGVFAFSSLRRDRVFVARLKDFAEKSGVMVRSRIAALRPGFYTRLGAAIRHTSAKLAERPSRKRLLLVLTDGKPNDLDHYEGRHGIEDTRQAVLEARRAGQAVFAITIDGKAESYVPRIFGANGFAIVSHPGRLTAALPAIYRHLVG